MAYKGYSGGSALAKAIASGAASGGGDGGFSLADVIKAPIQFPVNLGKDVVNATLGIPGGIKQIATDPVESFEAMGKSIAHTWAPLFTGHPVEFLEEFYHHPLAPILDVAAVFTMGAASAGRAAQLASKAQYTTKAAGHVGQRTIALPAKRPGAFQKPLEAPSRVDRLAAYSRPDASGKKSITLQRTDVPGRAGRNERLGDEARLPIYHETQSGVASKLRQEAWHNLTEQLATKGGRWGRLAQMPYEAQYVTRLAGSVGAMEFMLGRLHSVLEKTYDDTHGIVRHSNLVDTARKWHDRALEYGVTTGRVLSYAGPKSAWKNLEFNKRAYGPAAKHSNLTKSRWTRDADGNAYKRSFGSGGVDMAVSDMMRLGNKMTDYKDPLILTGKKAEQYGLDPSLNHIVLLDKHTMRNMGYDAGKSLNAAWRLFYRGTSVWKTILLGLSPRFFVNNLVGNSFLYAMNEAGSGAIFGYREAWRQLRNEKSYLGADKTLHEALKTMGAENWMQQYFSDQLGQSLHHSNLPVNVRKKAAVGTAFENRGFRESGRLEKVAQKALFAPTSKFAEQLYRRAVIAVEIRKDARMVAEMNRLSKANPKWSKERVFNESARNMLKEHKDLQRQIREQVENVMGNYSKLSSTERKVRDISPFYTWQRHIVRNSAHMAKDRPVRTAFMAEVGKLGSEATMEALGEVPSWMRGLVPIGDPESNDRFGVVATGGLNPYAQVGELAETAATAIPGGESLRLGETLGSLVNPFIQSGVEELTGTRLLTGQPLYGKPKNMTDRFLTDMKPLGAALRPWLQLPQATIVQRAVDPREFDDPTLYAQSTQEALLGYLGIPIKNLYLQRAQQLGRAEAKRKERGY